MERDSHERVKTLLKDTITLLCKNGIDFRHKFSIEALIGITVDDNKVVLMSINELVRTNEDQNNDNDSDLSDDTSAAPEPTPTAYTAPNRRVKKTPKRKITNDDDEELPEDIIDFKKFRNTEFIKEEQDDWAYPDALQHEVVKTPDGSSYLITKQPELEDSWLQPPPDNPGDPLVQEMLGGGVPTDPGEGTSGQAEMTFSKVGDGGNTKTTPNNNDTNDKSDQLNARVQAILAKSTEQPSEKSPTTATDKTTENPNKSEQSSMRRNVTTYRQWSPQDMESAIIAVLSRTMTMGAASRVYRVPNSTLKRRVKTAGRERLYDESVLDAVARRHYQHPRVPQASGFYLDESVDYYGDESLQDMENVPSTLLPTSTRGRFQPEGLDYDDISMGFSKGSPRRGRAVINKYGVRPSVVQDRTIGGHTQLKAALQSNSRQKDSSVRESSTNSHSRQDDTTEEFRNIQIKSELPFSPEQEQDHAMGSNDFGQDENPEDSRMMVKVKTEKKF